MAEASIHDMALFALFDGCNVRALAKVAGLSRPHHFLRPSQLLQLQQAAGAVGPLRVMADELGYGLYRTGKSLYDGDPLRVLAQAVRACSDLHVQAADAYADAERDPAGMSRNAMRRVERAAEDAHEAIGHVLVALRSMLRTAPKVD